MTATARRLQGADKAPFFGALDERMLPEPSSSSARLRSKSTSSHGKAEVGTRRLSLASTEKALELCIRVELAVLPWCLFAKHRAAKTDSATGRAGLGVGVADLVGIVTMPNGIGRACHLEVKRPHVGRISDAQRRWINVQRRRGAYACVVRSVTDALAAVTEARAGVLLGPL